MGKVILNTNETLIVNLTDKVTELTEKCEQLEKENAELKAQLKNNPYVQILQNEKAEMAEDFAKQIEKMKNIIYEEVDFCSYCPLKDCKNDEGTCPYEYLSEEEQKKILAEWIIKNGS